MKNPKIHFILTFLLFTCLLMGCVHVPAPYRPNSWLSSPIDLKSIADNPSQPLLQIIIVYGPAWCHHSALRLVCPDRPVLFWDPGGSYGIFHQEDIRNKDLILINPPDLESYLHPGRHRHRIVEQGQGEGDLRAQDHARGHLRES